jgi:PfaD family protein
VAEKFISPAPRALLDDLVARGQITVREAELAARIPVAEDITVEADSGGHTDNRPLVSLLPRIMELRDTLCARFRYGRNIRIGAAGGLGTPHSVASALSAGAAYVLTGSVNQTCVEAGISADAKEMLARADIADVMMAPAPDMFELGAKVQVLRKGTMFGPRANQLYQIYREYGSLDEIHQRETARLERTVLGATIADIWVETRRYWQERNPAELSRAEADPKHRMALVFRWYLGKSSSWAIQGEVSRRADYQLWCGPAMGAFNLWAEGSFLADPANRDVVQIARNLLEGAAVLTRAHQLRTYGVPVPSTAFRFVPRRLT